MALLLEDGSTFTHSLTPKFTWRCITLQSGIYCNKINPFIDNLMKSPFYQKELLYFPCGHEYKIMKLPLAISFEMFHKSLCLFQFVSPTDFTALKEPDQSSLLKYVRNTWHLHPSNTEQITPQSQQFKEAEVCILPLLHDHYLGTQLSFSLFLFHDPDWQFKHHVEQWESFSDRG